MRATVARREGREAQSPLQTAERGCRRGFTLIELMLVMGILALVLGMGIPTFYKAMHKEPMRRALTGVTQVFANARAQAIVQGKTVRVVFHPLEGTFAIEGGGGNGAGQVGTSGVIEDSLGIEMLDINLVEFRDADVAPVRFFQNGTTDEFTLILHSDRNEWQKLSLEPTTGIVTVGDVR